VKLGRSSIRLPGGRTAVRLQLHALTYNLNNFMRTLALPKAAQPWSLTSLREKLIHIGAKVVRHGRYVTFQMAEVAVSDVRGYPDADRPVAGAAGTSVRGAGVKWARGRQQRCAPMQAKPRVSPPRYKSTGWFDCPPGTRCAMHVA
jgi:hypothetical protein